ncbi:MAG: glycerophosphodiester phosphodiesterase [Flavobacteriaceae bacterium]|nr:glycerophosphodiester phosphodiesterase [Flavobacteriaceae bacterium]
MTTYRLILILLLMNSCQNHPVFDLQGHRGARGLLPENTWPAFEKALSLGVTTLEMDVVITKDHLVVVSHEPWFNPAICLSPDGKKLPDTDTAKVLLYALNYDEIATYDCGSLGNPRFPEQEAMKVHKPLLSDVISKAEAYTKTHGRDAVAYNIEIKSTVEGDGTEHPDVAIFSDLVYEQIKSLPRERLTIQSFDFRVLRYFHQKYPDVRLAALVEESGTSRERIAELGFTPAIYSPEHVLLIPEEIAYLHDLNIKVIPWTVNEVADMKQLLDWGVDGLITDYPNRAVQLLKKQ